MPLTFIHLSDIHFGYKEDGTQFDLDKPLRNALLRDLARNPATVPYYDAILVTGDIAYSGNLKEYARAQQWLDEICTRTKSSLADLHLVPGNHDVDRRFTEIHSALWNNHERIRDCNPLHRHNHLRTQLQDRSCDVLAPLEAYNNFAKRYESHSTRQRLAWIHKIKNCLSDGSHVVLHGLNSALMCDVDGDGAPGKLFLSGFQFDGLDDEPNCIRVILCHHPPSWLLDRLDVEDKLIKHAHVQLYGHEHKARSRRAGDTIQIFAGAVHPERTEAGWLPCYHIVQLETTSVHAKRHLSVKVFSREWKASQQEFVTAGTSSGAAFEETLLPLPSSWAVPIRENTLCLNSGTELSSTAEKVMNPAHKSVRPAPDARRLLVVHFLGLGTPIRYTIADGLGLLRDDDYTLAGFELWSRVLDRAEAANQLSDLWDAVSKHDKSLIGSTNPFQK